MIENDLQYAITGRAAMKFATALGTVDRDTAGLDPILQQAFRDALQSQLDDLRAQLAEYDAARGQDATARERTGADSGK